MRVFERGGGRSRNNVGGATRDARRERREERGERRVALGLDEKGVELSEECGSVFYPGEKYSSMDATVAAAILSCCAGSISHTKSSMFTMKLASSKTDGAH